MEKGKHTPGPWGLVMMAGSVDSRVNGYGIKYGSAGNRLAFVDGEGNSSRDNEANARLIAAAPELLDALDRILRAHDSDNCGVVNGEAVLCQAFATQARHAIAKALGVEPDAVNAGMRAAVSEARARS